MDILDSWEGFIANSKNLNMLYQSVEWFHHLKLIGLNNETFLCVVRNSSNDIVSIMPILLGEYSLNFEVFDRPYLKKKYRTIFLLGSEPLISHNYSPPENLFDLLFSVFIKYESIYIDSLPSSSYFWWYLENSNQFGKILHLPSGRRQFHTLKLSSDFNDYLSKFKSKTRNTFKRKIKSISKACGKKFIIQKIDNSSQIELFLNMATIVSNNSWQKRKIGTRIRNNEHTKLKLIDLTKRNILRSYLLLCNDHPCAFVLGYQYKNVFHYIEVAYDQNFSKFSPGQILLYHIIEDLHNYCTPNFINFGVGNAEYKNIFGNIHSTDASFLVLHDTITNKLICSGHTLFKTSINSLKSIVKKLNN